MKALVILTLQLIVVFCEDKVVSNRCYRGLDEAAPPLTGFCPVNEVYACGYSEATCTQMFFCGTPPCHYRCWCTAGYKRLAPGQGCVRYCPVSPIKKLADIE